MIARRLRIARDLRHEIRGPALQRVRAERRMALGRRAVGVALLHVVAREDLRIVRLADHDLHVRTLFPEHPRNAQERAAGPRSRDPVIEPRARERLEDLDRRRLRMKLRVRLVLELLRPVPAVLLRQFPGLLHHARAFQRRRRQHDLRAEEAHELSPLDREALRHRDHERIALRGAHHREPDAGIAGRRLDDRLARAQLAASFRRLDHAEREPVLDRAHRVEGLELHVDVNAVGREAIEADDRRAADGLEDIAIQVLRHGIGNPEKGGHHDPGRRPRPSETR